MAEVHVKRYSSSVHCAGSSSRMARRHSGAQQPDASAKSGMHTASDVTVMV